jgi:SPP1 gp7 family putative phage head morphogenesis protein
MKKPDIYERSDKVAEYIQKQYVREFSKYSNIANFDAINVIKKSKKLYEWLDKVTREAFLMMAKLIYNDEANEDGDLAEAWLSGVLDEYDPVTKYVYSNEWERKRQMFAEGVIASETVKDKNYERNKSMRYLARQATQYTITIADKAQLEAFKANGVRKVRWDSENDTRVCEECHSRHGKVYAIYKIPPKPHYGCRCHLIPIVEESE